jgi:hypothetical protein
MLDLLERELRKDRRPNDGLLHASSHFTGSLRHVQLEVAGAPQVERPFAQEMPLYLGTYMHELIHRAKRGTPYMAEVDVSPWMPEGWGGTADSVAWYPTVKRFYLEDYKTTKGESLRYIEKDGAKPEHKAQASLYWYALEAMGLTPLAPSIGIWYLPKNDVGTKGLEPLLVDFPPLPRRPLYAEAAFRKRRVDDYRESLGIPYGMTDWAQQPWLNALDLEAWLTSELEPVQDRLQKLFYDRATETWDVKLVPHWSAAYCPFPDELCDCSVHGTEKIGMYDVDGSTYYARKGYEDIEPEVSPA